MEEWISLKQFMKDHNIGYTTALKMIADKKVESFKTEGGQYKIKVGGNTVSNEMYEKVIRENEELKTKLKTILAILN